ncbi:MAG TPA: hypothetical protein VK602_13785 [Phyllobacterium sp.]|nr:hypothetical protein [Phyllobacterium sp.]
MPSMTLVPVDHEPDFGGVSFLPVDHAPDFGPTLVPVEHNPFSADDMVRQARAELASQPERLREPEMSAADQAAMSPETFANPYVRGLIDNAASLPRRAIENSQNALDTGTYDPGPTLEAATLPMGSGAIAGVPVRAGEAVLGAGPIRAYHGSPHDFDAFDLSKIGTGEGAQAYGHGLYFADKEGIAKSYRDALARDTPTVGGKTADPSNPEHLAATFLDQYKTPQAAIKELNDSIAWSAANPQFALPKEHITAAQQAKDIIASGRPLPEVGKNEGRMYEVNINADPEHFLDWDKPLSQQHPQTQDAVKQAMGIDYYGKPDPAKAERMWQQFKSADAGRAVRQGFIASDDKLVADRLNQAGIPGIKYLDQGSRAAGDGSRNYVVFNDKLIDIVRKYAAAGIALPPAIAAEYEQMKASQQPPANYAAGLGLH